MIPGRLPPLRTAVALAILGVSAAACSDAPVAGVRPPPPVVPQMVPAPGGIRRLLSVQYRNSVRVLLGPSAAAAADPPPDHALHGFDSIGAEELALSPSEVTTLEASANAIATVALETAEKLGEYLTCAPSGPGDAGCHAQFVANLGRLAWRRALESDEIERLTAIAQGAAVAFDSFDAGLVASTSAILQSPNFVYVIEIGEPTKADPAVRALTPGELLTRMSFVLLDQTPDRALVDEVDAGGLAGDEAIRALAAEMLERDEARAAVRAMYGELFRTRDLTDVTIVPKSTQLFPNFTGTLREALEEEVLRLVDDLVWDRDADFRELLTADYAFVNSELAAFYGMSPPSGDGYEKRSLPAGQGRAGLLGTAAFLARNAHADRTSPTRRGLFVRSTLLCQKINPPPPGVNTKLPPDDPDKPQTLKEKLEKHRTDPSCAGCHGLTDPIGLSLEKYGPVGTYRSLDHGLPIDTETDVEDLGHFSTAAELGALLAEDDRFAACMVKSVWRNALGHFETDGELPAVEGMSQAFAKGGYRMKQLLVELVASPAFQLVGEPK